MFWTHKFYPLRLPESIATTTTNAVPVFWGNHVIWGNKFNGIEVVCRNATRSREFRSSLHPRDHFSSPRDHFSTGRDDHLLGRDHLRPGGMTFCPRGTIFVPERLPFVREVPSSSRRDYLLSERYHLRPGGTTVISRWLSVATPPVSISDSFSHPGGMPVYQLRNGRLRSKSSELTNPMIRIEWFAIKQFLASLRDALSRLTTFPVVSLRSTTG